MRLLARLLLHPPPLCLRAVLRARALATCRGRSGCMGTPPRPRPTQRRCWQSLLLSSAARATRAGSGRRPVPRAGSTCQVHEILLHVARARPALATGRRQPTFGALLLCADSTRRRPPSCLLRAVLSARVHATCCGRPGFAATFPRPCQTQRVIRALTTCRGRSGFLRTWLTWPTGWLHCPWPPQGHQQSLSPLGPAPPPGQHDLASVGGFAEAGGADAVDPPPAAPQSDLSMALMCLHQSPALALQQGRGSRPAAHPLLGFLSDYAQAPSASSGDLNSSSTQMRGIARRRAWHATLAQHGPAVRDPLGVQTLLTCQCMFIDQQAGDRGCLEAAWFLTGVEPTPCRVTSQHTEREAQSPFSPLVDFRWLSAQGEYMKELQVFRTRLDAERAAALPQQPPHVPKQPRTPKVPPKVPKVPPQKQ